MRSRIGTQSRLAAHIAAGVLLILMLVYGAPSPAAPVGGPVPAVEPVVESGVEPVREAVVAAAPVVEPVAEPVVQAVAEPVAEPVVEPMVEAVGEPIVPVEPEPVVVEAEPAAEPVPVPVSVPAVAVEPEPVVDAASVAEPAVVAESVVADVSGGAEVVPGIPAEPAAQPDESGALVVAPVDAGSSEIVVAPLKNANLEVLGDGVYWLSPRHDLEAELAAIPEIANLIVLAPLPGHVVVGFDHVKTDVIPADPADLTRDAADQFVYLAGKKPGPVVAAALPGARGAAFFKAAYLIRSRGMNADGALREVAVELEEAGSSREEVAHRVLRLAGGEE